MKVVLKVKGYVALDVDAVGKRWEVEVGKDGDTQVF